jgi:diguanylate cyclase (GGDEF)-like protein/putative nucleotidyltransferase with HDIG domain
MLAATATTVLASLASGDALDGRLLAVTLVLCAGAALFEVLAPGNISLQVSLVFFTWGAMLLPPWAIAALAVASFAASAFPARTRWYVAGFNAANYAIAGIAAHQVCEAISADHGYASTAGTLGLLAAAGTIVAVNHLLIVAVVHFAHGRSLASAVEESFGAIPLDLGLALSGGLLAALWTQQQLLAILAIGPLLLMYRGLYVPMLRHKSRLDPKTGLYNFEHFGHVLARSLTDARREGTHVGVLMIDLDHLRAVNNRWGHLAGDRLIRGLADVIAAELQPADIAARFGGEEFCVVLPGAAAQRSLAVAEAIRRQMAESVFSLSEGSDELQATVSIGVAVFPEHGANPDTVLDAADAAVYDAKLGGRNRVRLGIAGENTRSIEAAAAAQAEDNGHLAATITAQAPPWPVDEAPAPAGDAPAHPGKKQRIFRPGVYALLAGTIAVAATSSTGQIADKPGIFAALIVGVLLLDVVRIDVFERGQVSPAAVPSIALAMLFGPLGPICAEAVIALSRVARRQPAIGLLADFGMLSLTGAATAGVWIALAPATHAAMIGGGAAAGITSYVVNALLMLALMSAGSRHSPLAIWREGWAWLWPHYLAFGLLAGGLVLAESRIGAYGLLLFAMPVLMLWLGERQYINRSRSSVNELRAKHDELERANTSLRGLVDEKQALVSRMHRSYLSTITSLARTIEAKDPYTGGHTERVARIACLVAEEMGFDSTDVRAINVGAVIHDIGKIGVPDRVLLKPGALDADELVHIRRHPEISSYILADLDLPAIVKQMVRSHHERYAGGGYPDGLIGEEIPLSARILSVADALDAMTSDRPYRTARPLAEALAEIDARSGEQFCPRVVAALHSCLRDANGTADELFGPSAALAF